MCCVRVRGEWGGADDLESMMALTYIYMPLAYLKSCRDFIVSGDVSKVRRLKTQGKSKNDGTSWQTDRQTDKTDRQKTEAYMGREGESEGWMDGWMEREIERGEREMRSNLSALVFNT